MKGCAEGRNCDVGKCVCATGAARARFALRWRNSGPLCQRCTDLILCICAGRNNVICKGEKEVQTSSKQPEGLSRFRHVRSKPDQEKVAISDKLSRRKKCQGQRVPRDHGVNSRASQAARRRSYRLSLGLPGLQVVLRSVELHPQVTGNHKPLNQLLTGKIW